ncbi:hypothetical protein [Breoghania sp.]|uniref:hypothetical protein n=1 Tax=Breoghania sp. TaxID=2065378 RepID=UPI003204973D
MLDGMAGLWCTQIGHGRHEVADAVHKQNLIPVIRPVVRPRSPISPSCRTRRSWTGCATTSALICRRSGRRSAIIRWWARHAWSSSSARWSSSRARATISSVSRMKERSERWRAISPSPTDW